MDWRLRRAEPGDAAALSLVAGATFLETFAGVLAGPDIVAHVSTKSSVAGFDEWIADPVSIITLAEHPVGDAPVGYTVLTTPADVGEPRDGDLELRRIYALAVTRGTGLGTALMARAVDDARGLGAKRLILGVLGTNATACAFYERQRFAQVGERRFKVGDAWHDDRVYARTIEHA